MVRAPFFLLCLLCACGVSPKEGTDGGRMVYSTDSDSAAYYYRLGWRQIMDEGRYGPAEASYRNALRHDPDFLLARATLARLSLDHDERLRLYGKLAEMPAGMPPDEAELLNVYRSLVRFTNLREESPTAARAYLDSILVPATASLDRLSDAYPNEPYLLSEYIEFLRSTLGGEVALDSLYTITERRNANIPFLLGYAAQLEAERGAFAAALALAERTEEEVGDSLAPKADAVRAAIYLRMDSLDRALFHARRAVRLDPRNLDASRLVERIESARTAE